MEEIAQVYSRSLFEVAKEQGKLDLVREQLGEFADALAGNRDLQVFFFSPYFSTEEKKDGLERAVSDADPVVLNFLALLVEKHRMPVIFRLRRQFDELWEREHQVLRVDVTSAVALDERVLEQIRARVGEQTHRRVQLASHVDPDILGGIVLRVGNAILDTSIRNRLENLRRQVAKAT
jgi:F-type H+-transporting ATPase subunit delta